MTQTQYLGPLPTNEVPVGTVDFISGTITDRLGNDLTMGIELAVSHSDDSDTSHAWLPATWQGDPGSERECKTVSVVDTSALDASSAGTRYGVYVRLDNTPAHPIVQIGWIVLTD